MNVGFNYTAPDQVEPVIFEKVLGEKPGGVMVINQDHDVKAGQAIHYDGDGFSHLQSIELFQDATNTDTTIQVAKNSGAYPGMHIGYGSKSVDVVSVDKTNSDYDVITLNAGLANMSGGSLLFRAQNMSASAAKPFVPVGILGSQIYANKGDQPARLIVAAVMRKENVKVAPEYLTQLPTINVV